MKRKRVNERLKKEIEVRDKIIGMLLKVVAENKIGLNERLLGVIGALYNDKLDKSKKVTQSEFNQIVSTETQSLMEGADEQ